MATSKKFSELPAASSVGNGDLFAIAHEDAQAETGYVSQKLTAAQAGQKVNGDTEYPTSLPSFPENGQNPFAALEKLNSDIIGLLPVSTSSGSIATFSTSLALPLVECKAEIVAQQASGTPTPANPLPISGFNSIELTHEHGESESETKTIALGQTVYGGVLDAKNGKLTITYGIYTFDGTEKWTKWADENTHLFNSAFVERKYGDDIQSISDKMKFYGNGATATLRDGLSNEEYGFVRTNTRIWVRFDDCSTTAEVQAKTNGITVCYPLETPVEITGLTGVNFTTFAGENNIFADSGDIEVSYKMGIQEYIDAKIAETQALIL